MLVENEGHEIPEAAISSALTKVSWKLLKRELDKFQWHKNPPALLSVILRTEALINKRQNAEKTNKRKELFEELISYISPKLEKPFLEHFKKMLDFFNAAETCFYEVLKFEGELSALKDLSPAVRLWSTMTWFVGDQNHLYRKIAEQFKTREPVFINNFLINGADNIPVDPSTYHVQQVEALGSAILMEAYRNSWFAPDGVVVIPDRVPVDDTDKFKAGSVLFNANIWALIDVLQEQVRYLGRDHQIIEPHKYDSPPEDFKFGIEFGPSTEAQFFDFIASQRNNTRESTSFFSINKDPELNSFLDAVATSGSKTIRDRYHAASSLTTLLNYDVLEDETLYEGLTLSDWIDGFCFTKEFCSTILSKDFEEPLTSELITFSQECLLTHLQLSGMTKEKSLAFIKSITFHQKSRDLFDTPLIKTSTGFVVIYDILKGCLISRAIVSNILSRKGEFKQKGVGLENEVKELFVSNGIETVAYKKKYPEPEGEYQYDALVLWGGKLFVLECKNRWLCEGRPVAIYNFLKQTREDARQVTRLVDGLKRHPEMVHKAFDREVKYDEIIPCVVAGLPYAMQDQLGGVFFTDISILTRFFSERHFCVEYTDKPKEDQNVIYKQWEADRPLASDLIKTLRNPIQVALARSTLASRSMEFPIGRSIALKHSYIYTKELDVAKLKDLINSLSL
ncbi:hypothetical protein KUU78_11585 [Pseudomonas aeruginosa]|uniref:hypothetical protein n=1 Tax=Pseudomonas aeruginosa TaxID=287 RepID=UPI001C9DC7F1|nr:hypothetical protein [Pseudomonas aeruginosa]MBY9623985.1 hypothetical protein [Pseudomonas aeruginosa]MBY9751797.1 hypothetical protein [Pseudomonas aeruginosa]MCA6843488.1 hypothetical protein [Pseudomonas aeruginosa]MCA6861435.1 hypothetical protein [Pseudomonas aeruginosa]QZV38765.1 hypothetical protein KUU78_11585 [Pseudomonas aeruginosa]